MKNTIKILGVIALVAGIGFSFAACDEGGGGDGQSATYTGTAGGETYKLKITKGKERYTAKSGDAYELTAGKKKSKGSVKSVESDLLYLLPDNAETPFTANVEGKGLTALNGKIKWTEGDETDAPGTLTVASPSKPSNPGGGGSMKWIVVNDVPFGAKDIYKIIYDNSMFVAVGRSGKMATSTDGIKWKAVDASSIFGDNTYDYIYAIAYGNGTFVAGGDTYHYGSKMATSPNGTTWTPVDVGNLPKDGIRAIAFGNGVFVAGGCDYSNGKYVSKMATSPNGTTWTPLDVSSLFASGNKDDSIRSIFFLNGMFVAGGQNGKIATSTNGTSWTVADVSNIFGTEPIFAIAYGNNMFVAGGEEGKIAYSTNGTNWSSVDVTNIFSVGGMTTEIHTIAYGNKKFIAAGNLRKMATSTNGTTWTAVDVSTFDNFNTIAYGNGKFVVGCSGGYIGYLSDK